MKISFSVCYRDSHINPYNFSPSKSGLPVAELVNGHSRFPQGELGSVLVFVATAA